MKSREQFLKTVNHQEPDRIVLDLGATNATGIHVQTISKLRRHFGLQRKPIRVIEPFRMLGEVGWELIDSIGIDVIGAWGRNNLFGFNNHAPYKEWKTPWGQRVMVPTGFNTTTDTNGNILMHPGGDTSVPPSAKMAKNGYYFETINRQETPGDAELNAENNLEEYQLINDKELEHWRVEVDKAYFSGKAVIASFDGTALGDPDVLPGMHLKHPKGIRDAVQWYSNLVSQPDYVKRVFERQTEIGIENLKRLYEVTGNKIHALFVCSTDFGLPGSTLFPSEKFDEIWLPFYQKINSWVHDNTHWKTFKHSVGAEEELVDGFVRAGFDIINPVQTGNNAPDLAKLKQRYGRDLVFWGGGVDTRQVLPFGKPEEVRRQVLDSCEIMNKNGGFVFSAVHNIPARVPEENMTAMLEAIQEFNGK